MDIGTLIPSAFTFISPCLQKTGEEFSKKAGGDLWGKVKGWFAGKKGAEKLKALEEAPEDAKQQGKVELLLEQAFEEDEAFKNEFLELVKKYLAEQPAAGNASVNIANMKGNKNINIQGNSGGNIHINN